MQKVKEKKKVKEEEKVETPSMEAPPPTDTGEKVEAPSVEAPPADTGEKWVVRDGFLCVEAPPHNGLGILEIDLPDKVPPTGDEDEDGVKKDKTSHTLLLPVELVRHYAVEIFQSANLFTRKGREEKFLIPRPISVEAWMKARKSLVYPKVLRYLVIKDLERLHGADYGSDAIRAEILKERNEQAQKLWKKVGIKGLKATT